VQQHAHQEERRERLQLAAGPNTTNSESPVHRSRTGSPSSRRCDACGTRAGHTTPASRKSITSARVKQLRDVAWKEAVVDAVADADVSRPLTNQSRSTSRFPAATPLRGRPTGHGLPSQTDGAAHKQVRQQRWVTCVAPVEHSV
jgi:hypothetical protein